MTAEELQAWLEEFSDLIVAFMDYEPTIDSDEELAMTLGFWFNNEGWNDRSDQLIHLGTDSHRGQFAAWVRPGDDAPPPIVYFGPGGGAGVLVRSPLDWATVLAHGPGVDEFPAEGPSHLDVEANWILNDEENEDMVEQAQQALDEYEEIAAERLGPLADFDTLVADLDDLNAEFAAWIAERSS